ncbi:MAG: 2-dehydropantoate 2-reductase N-terminal domain-containing protein [Rhodospirillales bacterium]
MARRILILGASYGSLLGTKLAMAGHDVTLVCRDKTAALIKEQGTVVRIQLRGEDEHREIHSGNLPGKVDATTPEAARPADYDLVALAMQEPQYSAPPLARLLAAIGKAKVPCLSIMNMPPLPFLKRLPDLDVSMLSEAFSDPQIWEDFEPGLVTLCSPDPQAFRPPEEAANVLHVGLPTNFKAAAFEDPAHTAMLHELADDIDAVRLDDHDVPVKLRVHDSVFVPLAKWSMLMTGNYRCVTATGSRPIRDAVHGDLDASASIYHDVDAIARKMGAEADDQVPFEKYAKAAEGLLKPSSAARAIDSGATSIERVDKVVQLIGRAVGITNADIDRTVDTVDKRLVANAAEAAA